jgi:outer membrane protein assembly factor BamD
MRRSLVVILALLLCACSLLPEVKDETSGWSANKLYSEAKDAIDDSNYTKAIKYLEKLEARFPYGRYAQQAQMELAYVYYKDDDQASSLAACDRFIKLYPNSHNVDYIFYLKGIVNFNEDLGLLGKLAGQDQSERDPKAARDSFEAFKELVTRFPDSKYTPDAIARMKYLVNTLASHDVHVARYYMKRGAYLAAANRAQYALVHYPRAPADEEALSILVKAYDKLGLTKLRDDANRIMHENFPHSPWYKKGYTGKKDPWWMLWGNAW